MDEEKIGLVKKVKKFASDNWENVVKGFGGSRDSGTKNTFGNFNIISDYQLASMYVGDGWQKKVASIPAGSMTREGISISDDSSGKIKSQLEALDTMNCFDQAITWQRVFRGGLIWMISSKPSLYEYKPGEKIDIKKLKVFSASEVRIEKMYGGSTEVSPGVAKAKNKMDPLRIGEVETFKILKNSKRPEDIIVNATQCLVFKGDEIPSVPHESFHSLFSGSNVGIKEYEYWGVGTLQNIYPQMSKYGIFESGMGKIGSELVVAIYKIAGLREILQSEGGAELMQNRITTIDASKSMINAMFLDAEGGEDFFRNSINLAGVPDLWDRFMMTISGVTNIPASKLFGRQASGMNNKGEQDERNYNDYITQEQGKDMKKNLITLLGHITGKFIDFTFNSPWAPSQSELVEMRKKQSETDKVYLENGVVVAEEIRKSRFEKGFSFETELNNTVYEESLEEDKDLPDEPVIEKSNEKNTGDK